MVRRIPSRLPRFSDGFGHGGPSGILLVAICTVAIAALTAGCTTGYAPSADEDGDAADVGTDLGGSDAAGGGGAGEADGSFENDGTTSTDSNRNGGDTAGDGEGGADGASNTCDRKDPYEITRGEIPLRPGEDDYTVFRVDHDVEVDTAGSTEGDGPRWDFSKKYSSDDKAEAINLQSVKGKWYRTEFPQADYATKLAGDREELGVYHVADEALELLGIVSPDEEGLTTKIKYSEPVPVLKFPLEKGASWQKTVEASGTYNSAVVNYDATYTSEVDAEGELKTPYGTFEVLRVSTVLEQDGAVSGYTFGTVRTFAFVAECFGTVATIQSEKGESKKEFETAAEIRRLTR